MLLATWGSHELHVTPWCTEREVVPYAPSRQSNVVTLRRIEQVSDPPPIATATRSSSPGKQRVSTRPRARLYSSGLGTGSRGPRSIIFSALALVGFSALG